MNQDDFMRDMPTKLRIIGTDELFISDYDQKRRSAVVQRRPDVFDNLSSIEIMNFVHLGLSYKDGHLDEWILQNWPIPYRRDVVAAVNSEEFLLQHLPRVIFDYDRISVPWTGCHYAGEPGDWLEYPILMGFDQEELLKGSFGDHSRDEGLAFLQSWLFFGLVCEALTPEANIIYKWWVQDYESTEQKNRNMMSPWLPVYLEIFAKNLRHPLHRPPWEKWETILRITLAVAEAFEKSFEQQEYLDNLDEEPESLRITWSILTFGQMLSQIALKCYGVESPIIEQWPDGVILDRRLQQRNWCPKLISRLKTTFTMDSLYYLSLLSWENPTRAYARFSSTQNPLGIHVNCSFESCINENINYDLYDPIHVTDNCKCNFVGPNIDELHNILDRKEIPILIPIRNESPESGQSIGLRVQSINSIPNTGYVAISHVWADGLGNEHENKLRECQLQKIVNLMCDLTGNPTQPFWLDTCCVPRDRTQRSKALDLMNDTYRLSDRVLVLDATLQLFPAHKAIDEVLYDSDPEQAEEVRVGIAIELLSRIACSSWTTRLWTLPEGQVSRLLYFQFSDCAVEIGELYASMEKWPWIGTSLVYDLRTFLTRLRPVLRTREVQGEVTEDRALLEWPTNSLDDRFIAMLHAIEWRSTSRRIDEVLCMAIQLNVNVPSIISPPEEQMQKLLAQINRLPADLMFSHGERISQHPYRWAPKSLLGYKDDFSFVPAPKFGTQMGLRTERGLLVKYESFQLHRDRLPDSRGLFFHAFPVDIQGRFSPTPNYIQKCFGMNIDRKNPLLSPSWCDSSTLMALGDSNDDFIVILSKIQMPGPPANRNPARMALIVAKEGQEGDITFARPLLTVFIIEMPLPAKIPELMPGGGGVNLWKGIHFPERRFCIG